MQVIIGNGLDLVYENAVSLGTGLILLLVTQSMRSGNFTVGDFALFQRYLAFVTEFTHFFGSMLALQQVDQIIVMKDGRIEACDL